MTLYHQTSPVLCSEILRKGFTPGMLAGGAIYFATSAAATYKIVRPPYTDRGCVLQAKVDVGRVWHKGSHHFGLSGSEVAAHGFDTVAFKTGHGLEYGVYSESRISDVRRVQ